MVKTRNMIKKEKFTNLNNLIILLPDEIERNIMSYFKDELISWDSITNKDSYKYFKNYINNGMGISFKSEKLIRKYYIKWLRSCRYEIRGLKLQYLS